MLGNGSYFSMHFQANLHDQLILNYDNKSSEVDRCISVLQEANKSQTSPEQILSHFRCSARESTEHNGSMELNGDCISSKVYATDRFPGLGRNQVKIPEFLLSPNVLWIFSSNVSIYVGESIIKTTAQ